ncbi:CD209 antigen-like protein C isoform X3 [Astyanax mexicanus]|uniref:CD209 antigen-like protein C isoform X3 n=1 Tax=Astyanax mexicanus TaxID=7994 RepID=UPI0020CB53F7|nr:CD209 antigen-like protein C isoform X3 [Astyanax mexicanus]
MSKSDAEDMIYSNDISRGDLGEVYENVDGVKECEVKREIKNIGSQKNLQTGRDAQVSRCYRLAAVGLGLLCVLLLTAITVLLIQFNHLTAERDQLQTSNTNLTAERDQLQTSHTNLTAERDQLQKERDKVVRGLGLFGWSYFNSSLYYLTTNKKTWSGSRDECKQKGSDLVIINSREEQEFINKTFLSTEAWLGLTDIANEGDFRWVDGSSLTLQFWWTGEPNDYQNEDCALTGFKHSKSDILTWGDYPCGANMYGLCEKFLS